MQQLISRFSNYVHTSNSIREIPTQQNNSKTIYEIKTENRKTIAEIKELDYDPKKKVKHSIQITYLQLYTLYNC